MFSPSGIPSGHFIPLLRRLSSTSKSTTPLNKFHERFAISRYQTYLDAMTLKKGGKGSVGMEVSSISMVSA
jgi:hypothetical protein